MALKVTKGRLVRKEMTGKTVFKERMDSRVIKVTLEQALKGSKAMQELTVFKDLLAKMEYKEIKEMSDKPEHKEPKATLAVRASREIRVTRVMLACRAIKETLVQTERKARRE